MSDADSIVIKRIIEQSFDIWEAKNDERVAAAKAAEKHTRLTGALPAWVACALSIGGIIMLAGQTNQRVNDNERRITTLEASDRAQAIEAQNSSSRLASIEAKIDILVGGRR